jgi:putative polyketide hydroxylase
MPTTTPLSTTEQPNEYPDPAATPTPDSAVDGVQAPEEATEVVVVGGSLVGLSLALFLSFHGVQTVVVERHAGSSPHPRAVGFTAATMEAYAPMGVTAQIPQAPPGMRLRRARVESLAGAWFEEADWTPSKAPSAADAPEPTRLAPETPYTGAAIAQDRLEPILRENAVKRGADVRMSTELVHFEQDDGGVTAFVRSRDGQRTRLRASYLVAADGHTSPVARALGMTRSGRGTMRTLRSVLFRAPLQAYLDRGIHQFEIDQADFKAFLTTYNDGRWVLMFNDDEERDAPTLVRLIHRAIGRDDLEVELITTGRWELSATIADRFSVGRVFLAGDAAHTLPPNRGGFGANTGIADAHNLAWKMAHVLRGISAPSLLDSYDEERRAIAWLRHQQIFARPDYQAHGQGVAAGVAILDDVAMELGQLVRSSVIVGAGDDLPAARRPREWRGQPGTRAPWLPLEVDGCVRDSLDLFGTSWVLATDDAAWREVGSKLSKQLGISLSVALVGPATGSAFHEAFGVEAGGASLVRPDGIIAFRSATRPTDPHAALSAALAVVAALP